MRKILFLDIDGVLNNTTTFDTLEKSRFPIDPYCAFLVGKIKLETECDVVLSSSWRHHDESVEALRKRVVPIIDVTGHCCEGIRGVEIHKWLTRNVKGFNSASYRKGGEHDVARIAILDDDSDMLLWQKDCFFQTNFEQGGLNDEIAQRVIAHLNDVI